MPLGLDPPAAGLPLLPARGYLTAIVLTAIVLGVRLAATPWFGTNVPYLPFYPAILLAAWLGGSGPGLLATALSAIAALYFLSATPGVASSQPAGLAALATFSATGACIAWSIVQNLLVNAGHAMHGKGRVEVAFTCDGRTCHVTVRDHGPGMSPDILDRVFTPFFTTKARGSGLGLPTARRLIEAHHGEITVSSPADGGTTFHIQLPLQAVVPGSIAGWPNLHPRPISRRSPAWRRSLGESGGWSRTRSVFNDFQPVDRGIQSAGTLWRCTHNAFRCSPVPA